ncbi:MAG: adenylate kinase [Propionibacteriaceae bacterium]
MRMLIMGPPGAGKGTQGALIAEKYDIPAISTGDMFRALRQEDSELARTVKELVDNGRYVPDHITEEIVFQRLGRSDTTDGFLLDGFPRTMHQVEALDGFLSKHDRDLDIVVSLVADVDEVVGRLLKRAQIEGRADDNEETIRRRQETYLEQTQPLIETYRKQGILLEVDAMGAVDEVAARIFTGIDKKLS